MCPPPCDFLWISWLDKTVSLGTETCLKPPSVPQASMQGDGLIRILPKQAASGLSAPGSPIKHAGSLQRGWEVHF